MKLFPSNKTSTHIDSFLTSTATRPVTTSWSGYAAFSLKQIRNRLAAKGPEPQPTAADFNFAPDDLLAPPPGLSLPGSNPAAPQATAVPQLTAADRLLPTHQEQREPTYVDTNETATSILPHVTGDSQTAQPATTLKIPTAPTEAEGQLHNLTHLPYETWCTH